MSRNLALVGFGLVSLVAAGCRDDGNNPTPVDLSHPVSTDMAGEVNVDMAVQLNYMTTTAHAVDTGAVAAKTAVRLTGLILIDVPTSFASSSGAKCTYQVIASDPACTTAPCGLYVDIVTPFMERSASAPTKCPYADTAGTSFFANSKVGDNIDITGAVDVYTPTGTNVAEHSIITDSVVKSAASTTATAIPVNIAASGDVQFANCYTGATNQTVANCPAGASWQAYEGTYVKLLPPAGGVLTIGAVSAYNFVANPGNIFFSSGNSFIYDSKDAGATVGANATFKSISGAVNVDFGGTIDPVFASDFAQ